MSPDPEHQVDRHPLALWDKLQNFARGLCPDRNDVFVIELVNDETAHERSLRDGGVADKEYFLLEFKDLHRAAAFARPYDIGCREGNRPGTFAPDGGPPPGGPR